MTGADCGNRYEKHLERELRDAYAAIDWYRKRIEELDDSLLKIYDDATKPTVKVIKDDK